MGIRDSRDIQSEVRMERLRRRRAAAKELLAKIRDDLAALDAENKTLLAREVTTRLAGVLAEERALTTRLRRVQEERHVMETTLALIDEEQD